MASQKKVVEVIVPDVHNNWEIYRRLMRVLDADSRIARVFLMGDLRPNEAIYYDKVAEFAKGAGAAKAFEKLKGAEKSLQRLIERFGEEGFNDALVNGTLGQSERKVLSEYDSAVSALNVIGRDIYAKESALDYDKHEVELSAIKKKHGRVQLFGTPGNHDTVFIKDRVKSVSWLPYDQTLESEGIIGALVCREKFGEMHQQFNGPNLAYAPLGPEGDDDYDDLAKSRLYQEYSGVPLDLIVSHCGGHWGKVRGSYRGGLGITKLGEENQGLVNYAGHDHSGIVYRDPKTKVLVIRPGVNYIAKVFREGKNVSEIWMYRVPQGQGGRVRAA
ncbi:hypothetical protein C4580_01490 [Candidatus Woesearchaeota archaeon]|nr:MAG: hypothetical protein C4580_01490 [Candidatus Woesearchaeota archaeon]